MEENYNFNTVKIEIKRINMKAVLLAIMAPIIATLGQVMLKVGMTQVGQITLEHLKKPITLAIRIFTNPLIASALPVYIVGFILWVLVLSKLELSYAYPFLALSYVFILIASWLILGETISPMRLVGVIIVCAGIVIIGFSN